MIKGTLRICATRFLILPCLVSLVAWGQTPDKRKEPPLTGVDQRASDDQDEVIKIDTGLVNVPVSVTDRDGRFIADLQQQEFKIYEEGVAQQIAFFAPVERSFNVVLLIDTSPSTRGRQKEIRAAAVSFIDQLRPNDNVMVVSFNGNIQVLNSATKDRRSLRKAIDQLRWDGCGTVLYGTVDALMNRFFRRLRGRNALVMLTDGEDNDARLRVAEAARKAPKNETWSITGPSCDEIPCSTYKSNMRDAEELDALIYPIKFTDPDGSIGLVTRNGLAEGYLRELALKTGGRFYSSDKGEDLTEVFQSIANELRYQYSLGYYVKLLLEPGESRRIKVIVARPNLAVRAKPSYAVAQRKVKTRGAEPTDTP